MAVSGVNISGTLRDIIDDTLGNGTLDIALCGYGSQVPRVPGFENIASPTVRSIPVDTTDGHFAITLTAGNDLIEPPGTYYTITFRDNNGDIAQVNAYQFVDGQSYDLSFTAPFDPSQPPQPLPAPVINQLQNVALDSSGYGIADGGTLQTFQITLTQDSRVDVVGDQPGNLYTFIFKQDATGGHAFSWPDYFSNPPMINLDPNGITVQTFVVDEGPTFYPISAPTWYTP